ncbi:hypothetical protein D3C80_1982010 [compost metagenome]
MVEPAPFGRELSVPVPLTSRVLVGESVAIPKLPPLKIWLEPFSATYAMSVLLKPMYPNLVVPSPL